MTPLPIYAFTSFTLAIVLLFIGKGITQRVALLRRYSIPEAVIGAALHRRHLRALLRPGVVVEFELGRARHPPAVLLRGHRAELGRAHIG